MNERNRKALQTRDAILDAAIDLFVKEGFERTSMDAIALAAGVAKGTLYYHYESKEGIIDAVVERYARAMETRLAAVEADETLTLPEKLEAFTRATKEVSAATFSKLHYVRYIDIHDKPPPSWCRGSRRISLASSKREIEPERGASSIRWNWRKSYRPRSTR